MDLDYKITNDADAEEVKRVLLSACAGTEGELLTKEGEVLMELKLPEAAPLWLARLLSEQQMADFGR